MLLPCVVAFNALPFASLPSATAANGVPSVEAVQEVGHYLFFEQRLSANGTKSCGACHAPELAFTDGYRRSVGIEADATEHNAPTLLNVAALQVLGLARKPIRGRIHVPPNAVAAPTMLATQTREPFFNTHPRELGLVYADTSAVLRMLSHDTTYQRLFAAAKLPFAWHSIEVALGEYVRGLNSLDSPYDRYTQGDTAALHATEQRGMALFFSARLACVSCHAPPYFTVATQARARRRWYVASANGIYYRVPTLRNVALTAPYMHDGTVRELSKALEHYPAKHNPPLNATERAALLAFLTTLTDTTYLHMPYFLNPRGVR